MGQKVVDDGYPLKAAGEVRLLVRNPLFSSWFWFEMCDGVQEYMCNLILGWTGVQSGLVGQP